MAVTSRTLEKRVRENLYLYHIWKLHEVCTVCDLVSMQPGIADISSNIHMNKEGINIAQVRVHIFLINIL